MTQRIPAALFLVAALAAFAGMITVFFFGDHLPIGQSGLFWSLLAAFIGGIALFSICTTPEEDTSLPDTDRRPPDPPEQMKLF